MSFWVVSQTVQGLSGKRYRAQTGRDPAGSCASKYWTCVQLVLAIVWVIRLTVGMHALEANQQVGCAVLLPEY